MRYRKPFYKKDDFTENSLPSTRAELFNDVSRIHFFDLVKIGLMLLAFFAPLLIVMYLKDYSYIDAYNNDYSNFKVLLIFSFIEVPLVILAFFGVAGVGQIYLNLSFMEPVFFLNDFKEGIKKNWKPTLVSAIIVALFTLLFNYLKICEFSGWFLAIPFGFNFVVIFPIILHTLFLNFVYTNKYSANLKLGCYLYLKHLPTTLLCTLLIVFPLFFELFYSANVLALSLKFVFIVLLFIFYFPFAIFGTQLNELRIFDKRINSTRFPEIVGKGLTKKIN